MTQPSPYRLRNNARSHKTREHIKQHGDIKIKYRGISQLVNI
jgi:hypothetical protein